MRTWRNEKQIVEKWKKRNHTRLGSSALFNIAFEREWKKKKQKLLPHGVFVFGHPSKYESRKTGLNFVERTTRGAVLLVYNPITACGATSFPGYHSFPKWAIDMQRGYINNSRHLARKYARIFCLRTLSVPRSDQFSESEARGKLWATRNRLCPRTNIRAYFRPKWRLLSLLSFKSLSQRAQFWKLGNI